MSQSKMKIVPIRMPEDWRVALRCRANSDQTTTSEYVRGLILADMTKAKQKKMSIVRKRGGAHDTT